MVAVSKSRKTPLLIGVAVGSLLAGLSGVGQAEQLAPKFATPKEQPVTVELIAEHASIRPGGSTRVGVHFTIQEGWHIYAEQPGDAGMPTLVMWRKFPGVRFGDLKWPKPQEFTDPGDIHTRGYAKDVVLSSRLILLADTRDTVPLEAQVQWLACHDVCIPGSERVMLSLPVSKESPKASPEAALFGSPGA